MRLTFVVATLSRGGAQRMLVELANGAHDRGHDVTVVLPQDAPVEFDVRPRIVRPDGGLGDVAAYPISDVVLSNFFTTVQPAVDAAAAGKGEHVRLALAYEPLFLDISVAPAFRSYFVSPKLLVLSNTQRELVRLLHGIDAHVVPAGVGPAFRDLGLRSDGPLTVTGVLRGGWVWHRDQDHLLDVLKRVRAARPHVRIQLVAPPAELVRPQPISDRRRLDLRAMLGPLRAPLGRLRRRLAAPQPPPPVSVGRVTAPEGFDVITPSTDEDLCAIYSRTAIFVASSVYGSIDLPPLEAMRCGAAVALTYSGGNTDYARHEDTCLMSFRHEGRLADDVVRLVDDAALRVKLADAGKRESERWTWERSTDVFLAALRESLGSAG